VIGGYTKGKGAREPLGSLLVGYWADGKLRYAAHVGTGFNDETIAMLRRKLHPLRLSALVVPVVPHDSLFALRRLLLPRVRC
jgi:ATP-dependent DNA ligase